MARYISQYDMLKLYQNDGAVRHTFKDGVLDLGTADIDATLSTTAPEGSLQRPFKNDALATSDLKKVGLGDLTTSPQEIRNFYAAELMTDGDLATAGDGLYYKVIDGVIVYDNKHYYPGDVFRYVDETLLATLTTLDVLSPAVPPPGEPIDRDARFKDVHLNQGDEPLDYYIQNEAGFLPRNSVATADIETEGFGYIR